MIHTIAKEFVRLLHEGGIDLAEIDRRNAAEESKNVCHSHDFCDPNEEMLQAFETVHEAFDFESEEHASLWNASWNYTVTTGFETLAP